MFKKIQYTVECDVQIFSWLFIGQQAERNKPHEC